MFGKIKNFIKDFYLVYKEIFSSMEQMNKFSNLYSLLKGKKYYENKS